MGHEAIQHAVQFYAEHNDLLILVPLLPLLGFLTNGLGWVFTGSSMPKYYRIIFAVLLLASMVMLILLLALKHLGVATVDIPEFLPSILILFLKYLFQAALALSDSYALIFILFIAILARVLIANNLPRWLVNVVAVGSVAGSFAISVELFLALRYFPEGAYLSQRVFTWIAVIPGAGLKEIALRAPLSLTFDRLSAVMCLVVTGVGGVIHLYSTGYMAHDQGFARYFAYLNLFTFAMLLLVMGGNILVMFVGWEGVGLCSYLLIGFWYEDMEKSAAGKKAFIVNRIGDFGFLVGIFTLLWATHTLDFYGMRAWAANHVELLTGGKLLGISLATFIGLSLFVGATGKSAQIPLHVWLPDAMAGPTPVSALIHAATMVTAGVYMIGRMNFIYAHSPTALMVVAAVGVGTALFSATIGFTQNDIKKVLAYSTVSQLGFMFAAMGVGAYAAGIFHLTTHSFFKALLFLGAGSVIHGLSGEQDMRKMGGLAGKLPITFATMAMAWLAISGIPPFAGFVSKDEILWKAFSNGIHPHWFNLAVYGVGLVAAVCTAIYMTRLMMMTFLTPSRMDHHAAEHAHESPWTMWVPLAALAALSVAGGLLNWPHLLGGGASFEHWLEPMWVEGAAPVHYAESVEIGLMLLSVAVALAAIASIYVLYKSHMAKTGDIAEGLGPLYRASLNKYWVDEIYDSLVIEPIKSLSYFLLFRIVDVNIVDGIANGLGTFTKDLAEVGKRVQTGRAPTYALFIVLGLLALLAYYYGFR
ncbi:MAG TPA: NADH-quinone oxidoreductase subunit L [bacterium]|nr:NADH-quinone oxidoreductase subunit L [bacterium]